MRSGNRLRATTLTLLVLLTLGGPAVFGPSGVATITIALWYAFLATAWNITGAYGGKLSLGHGIFVGIGAYASSMLLVKYGTSPWLGMFLGAALAAAAGLALGWLGSRFRLEGIFFAMVTLAFSLLAVQLANNVHAIGAAEGLLLPLGGGAGAYEFTDPKVFTYIAGGLTLLALIVTWVIRSRRLGMYIAAVGLNERAAQGIGLSPTLLSSVGLAIGGAVTALGGTFYAQQNLFIDPGSTFAWTISLAILLPAILGGRSLAEGPFFGALLLIPIEEQLRQYAAPGASGAIEGVVLVILVMFLPEGLLPWLVSRQAGIAKGLDWRRRTA